MHFTLNFRKNLFNNFNLEIHQIRKNLSTEFLENLPITGHEISISLG